MAFGLEEIGLASPWSGGELPRLTTMLRTYHTDGGRSFDVQAEYLRRSDMLEAQRDTGSTVGHSAFTVSVIPDWNSAPAEAKRCFEQFLVKVERVIGSEACASDDLHEAARVCFSILASDSPSDREFGSHQAEARDKNGPGISRDASEKLTSMFGTVPRDLLHSLAAQAAELRGWQARLGGSSAATTTSLGFEAVANGGAEYGANFDFVYPDAGASCPLMDGSLAHWLDLDTSADDTCADDRGGTGGAGSLLEVGPSSMAKLRQMVVSAGGHDKHKAPLGSRQGAAFHSSSSASTSGSRPMRDNDEPPGGMAWDAAMVGLVPGEAIDPGTLLAFLKDSCDNAVASSGSGGMSSGELAKAVCRQLASDTAGDEVAGQLLELMGDAAVEVVTELLQRRAELQRALRKRLDRAARSGLLDAIPAGGGGGGDGSMPYSFGGANKAPSVSAQVTIMSESERVFEKERRKRERKEAMASRKAGVGGGGDHAAPGGPLVAQIDALSVDDIGALLLGEGAFGAEGGPAFDMDALVGKGVTDTGGGYLRGALPKGTTRTNHKGYEEVFVPAVSVRPPEIPLVQISALEEFAQPAFEGYTTLNRIQSALYSTAAHSNVNMLVCAPTGAGKTNIAMLAMLHEVGQHLVAGGGIDKDAFKVVYVAPMKALAAEVTATFARRLAPLGLTARELTGDMQLTKKELAETQLIVTTPEKWDVITRKSSDVAVSSLVRLLIIDEIHLLNDERGPVIETLVARTLRLVETSQAMIRIVGLSATLPNPDDVARFLCVPTETGLFTFGPEYRPVPLEQTYVGVSEPNYVARAALMSDICYRKVAGSLRRGHQAMVFVHSRKDTVKSARQLVEAAQRAGETALFDTKDHPRYALFLKDAMRSRAREVAEFLQAGVGVHHAGMLRADRSLTEAMFAAGVIKVIVCTATLAWGVNLPTHTVVIKGTQVYDAAKGGFKELDMLDVMQIFGRAGRPQFDTLGEGIIITQHAQLAHYLQLMMHQMPIESQYVARLRDNLNAEVVLGTVSNVREACTWLSYTYLSVRMSRNPLHYGISWDELASDPSLGAKCKQLVTDAARALDKAKMLRFDERGGHLYVTELGRVASHYYLQYESVEEFSALLQQHMEDPAILHLVCHSAEFNNVAVREEEGPELETLARSYCPIPIKAGLESRLGKINVLIQAYISRARVDSFSLTADMMYVSSNLGRIFRALFEITLRRGWSSTACSFLAYCVAVERRVWPHQHPLRQLDAVAVGGSMAGAGGGSNNNNYGRGGGGGLPQEILYKLEEAGRAGSLEALYDMGAREIGSLVRHPAAGAAIREAVDCFPSVALSASISPITRSVLRVTLDITPTFRWKDKYHGMSQRWHILVEDSENEHVYHSELFTLSKKAALGAPGPYSGRADAHSGQPHGGGGGGRQSTQRISFSIPIFEPLPSQYYIRAVSDSWIQAETTLAVSFQGLILPHRHPPHTELLDLHPLPLAALGNPEYEALYQGRFTHFNPIQTQAFHTLYHSDHNVLLGAPTGSGKTISAELAMLRLFRTRPHMKAIYIAPLKALVRERIEDWGRSFAPSLKKRLVELTGDVTPDLRALLASDIIVCTPEKWDGISRNWRSRDYVQKVGLLIIDEIHLLGGDRGPILEVIVSRMRYVAMRTGQPIRFLGLSTALANARDLADWIGIGPSAQLPMGSGATTHGMGSGSSDAGIHEASHPRVGSQDYVGLFNFKPSVRPVPLEVHIQGYPGKHYCPRMATMNKPAYAAIQTHSPLKPVLIFVSSRRQTRLTALDLIAQAAADENPRGFLRGVDEDALAGYLARCRDPNLKHTLQFGIGLHHAGLGEWDRKVVEELFVEGKIQVLVATATLAWGVNFPAHLVIVKGTEYYDAATRRYVDYPITDVLQMMGRAGRPQFDSQGKAVIMVHEPKKSFYKKFLYEPFPVESALRDALPDHINAEVVAGTITTVQDAMDYLTWTFFFRRLLMNPSYYDLQGTSAPEVDDYLSTLVRDTLDKLEEAGCVACDDAEEGGAVEALSLGRIASFYYLQYTTAALFGSNLGANADVATLLAVLCHASEFDELPVRHNEDGLNAELATHVRLPVDMRTVDDPHTKANLLLQAHLSQLPLPISDYVTDTKSVLDNAIRLMQAMIDIAAEGGWLTTSLAIMCMQQMVMQGAWEDESLLLTLPHVTREALKALEGNDRGSGASGSGGAGGGGNSRRGPGGGKSLTLQELVAGTREEGHRLLATRLGLSGPQAEAAMDVVGRLPVMDVRVSVQEKGGEGGRGDSGEGIGNVGDAEGEAGATREPPGNGTLVLSVELERKRANGGTGMLVGKRGLPPRVHAPRFPKAKEEGWWLVVGDASSDELLALKRVTVAGKAVTRVTCPYPAAQPGGGCMLTIYLVSDSYLGVDKIVPVVVSPCKAS